MVEFNPVRYEIELSVAEMSGAEKSNGPRFSYDSGYLATPNATAISRSLPLVGESLLPPKHPGVFRWSDSRRSDEGGV